MCHSIELGPWAGLCYRCSSLCLLTTIINATKRAKNSGGRVGGPEWSALSVGVRGVMVLL